MSYQCDQCGKYFSRCQVFEGYIRILNVCSKTCYEQNGWLEKEVLNDKTKLTQTELYNGSIV